MNNFFFYSLSIKGEGKGKGRLPLLFHGAQAMIPKLPHQDRTQQLARGRDPHSCLNNNM